MRVLAFTGLALLGVAPALAQVARIPACVTANDDVTRMRLGKDRAGRPSPIDLPGSVARGDRARGQCSGDDGFMLAYALARIDLSGDTKRGTPTQRTALFNAAVADLEGLRGLVVAGRSSRYEIFNILGLIYNSTGQPKRGADVTASATPFLPKMTAESRQKTLITQGVAQAQLGQSAPAAKSFDLAKKAGSNRAGIVAQKMLY
jgi:hypothetical protein